MKKEFSVEDHLIRRQVLLALSANRTPGFHFPGHFLQLDWPRIGADELEEAMPGGPHCHNADGAVSLVALGVLLDTALATAPRLKIERGARQATVHLHAQFTGEPLRGPLRAHVRLDGFTCASGVRQGLASGAIYAGNGRPVCHASGAFVVLPPPQGVRLAPLPWQRASGVPSAPIGSTRSLSTSGARCPLRPVTARAAR